MRRIDIYRLGAAIIIAALGLVIGVREIQQHAFPVLGLVFAAYGAYRILQAYRGRAQAVKAPQ